MVSGRESIIELIEKYKELECLWKVNDKNYKNKQKRLNATEQLVQVMRKTDANANADTAIRKINTLRSSFNKEHNKVKASCRSGASTDDIHVPKLWYYDLLSFLADRDTEARKSRDIPAMLNVSIAEAEDAEDAAETGASSPSFSRSSSNSQGSACGKSKRKMRSSSNEFFSNISSHVDEPKLMPNYNAFGEHVAEKLRCMPEGMALYCQKLINEAIYYADCGKLNRSSHIVTGNRQTHTIHTSEDDDDPIFQFVEA